MTQGRQKPFDARSARNASVGEPIGDSQQLPREHLDPEAKGYLDEAAPPLLLTTKGFLRALAANLILVAFAMHGNWGFSQFFFLYCIDVALLCILAPIRISAIYGLHELALGAFAVLIIFAPFCFALTGFFVHVMSQGAWELSASALAGLLVLHGAGIAYDLMNRSALRQIAVANGPGRNRPPWQALFESLFAVLGLPVGGIAGAIVVQDTGRDWAAILCLVASGLLFWGLMAWFIRLFVRLNDRLPEKYKAPSAYGVHEKE